jgi:hypothetical protein
MQISHPGHPWVKRWLIALTVVIGTGWLLGAGAFIYYLTHSSLTPPAVASLPADPEKPVVGSPLPAWGRLIYAPIMIGPPLEFVPENAPFETHETVWHFPGMNASRATDLLGEIGVSDATRQQLMGMMQLDPSTSSVVVHPSREFILDLSPDDRGKLYVTLAGFQVNHDHSNAYRFRGSSFDQWFPPGTLLPESRALIEPLVYHHNGYLFFCDLRSIEQSIESGEERMLMLRALSREATFLAKLFVDEKSDIEGLVNYWSRGGRTKDIRPLIESLAEVPGGQAIDIIHLLPRFARARIFTYPPPPEKQPALNRDCHWTAFNFFELEPDDRFCVDTEIVRTLDAEYYRVFGNLQLGDLVMYFNDGNAIHSCVYIADDVVFTKNGNTSSRPWMFARLGDMRGYYPSQKPLEVRYYRKNSI